MRTTRHISDKGIVLVLALWVIVILSGLAMNFALNSRTGSIVTRNFKESIIARTIASSAIENTIAYILTDPDPFLDYIDEDGIFRTDRDRKPASGIINVSGATVEITLTDEDSKLNINTLEPVYLHKLLANYAKNDEETLEMVASLLDWMDIDDLHRMGGAEDDEYFALGYETKDNPLEIPAELTLIKGFNKDIIFGEGGLDKVITTFTKSYNINTASREVLEALGFNALETSTIIETRESMKGLRNVDDSLSQTQKGSTFSDVLRIETWVSFKGSQEEYHIISIVKREIGKRQLRTIYRRETIETGRT